MKAQLLNYISQGVTISPQYLAMEPAMASVAQELLRAGSVVWTGRVGRRALVLARGTGKRPVSSGTGKDGTGKKAGTRKPSKLTSVRGTAVADHAEVMPLDIRDVPGVLTGRRPRTASGVARILNEHAQSLGYSRAPYFKLADLIDAGVLTVAQAKASLKRRAKHLRRHFGTTE